MSPVAKDKVGVALAEADVDELDDIVVEVTGRVVEIDELEAEVLDVCLEVDRDVDDVGDRVVVPVGRVLVIDVTCVRVVV